MPAPSTLLRARTRVGPSFFARIGAVISSPAPRGLVDRIDDLARPGLDTTRIDPAIHPFLLDPASLEIRIESTWRGLFALAWRIVRPLFGFIGQLQYPLRHATIRARTLALDPVRDGRADVRGVIREYTDSPAVMHVMAYATHRENDRGYMSAAFPFPPGALCGLLRMDLLDTSDPSRSAIRLTSRRDPREGHEPIGVWFALGPFRIPLPLEETLDLYPTDLAPHDLRSSALPHEPLVGLHVQKFLGLRVVTHRYYFRVL